MGRRRFWREEEAATLGLALRMRSHGEQARWRQFCLWSLKVEDGGELGLVGGLELDGLVG
jgi:hypothetical protein